MNDRKGDTTSGSCETSQLVHDPESRMMWGGGRSDS